MPYIGQEPVAGNFVLLDAITTSATATYALTKNSVAYSPESSRNMIVSLNGVTQAPEAAYTVSGSNITFSSALTASDVIDYILVLGDVLDIGRPSDGVVGTDQMNYPLGNFSSTGIDDNATSTAITIDSSENVGIGTASPTSALDVVGQVISSDSFKLTTNVSTPNGNTMFRPDSNTLAFGTNSIERMRIDSSGHVGIGTDSPASYQANADDLVVATTGHTGITIASGTSHLGNIHFADGTSGDDAYRGFIQYEHTANYMRFATNASEAMRIDSSGNLLVGTTSLAVSSSTGSVTGTVINATGLFEAAKTGTLMELNRLTDDGTILNFRKDGTTVGSIGNDSTALTIGSGSTGIKFGTSAVWATTGGSTNANGTKDLGASTVRWKDLYLSGRAYINDGIKLDSGDGIYFGQDGTAANKLDDYEEGTWTPTITDATNNATMGASNFGQYTKIGRLVICQMYVETTSLGSIAAGSAVYVSGWPFSIGKTGGAVASQASGLAIGANQSLTLSPWASTVMRLAKWDATTGTTNLVASEWSADGAMYITISYEV